MYHPNVSGEFQKTCSPVTGTLPDFERAFEFFLNRKFELPNDEDSMIDFQRALDYFIHDYRLPDGKRVIERFAADPLGKHRARDARISGRARTLAERAPGYWNLKNLGVGRRETASIPVIEQQCVS